MLKETVQSAKQEAIKYYGKNAKYEWYCLSWDEIALEIPRTEDLGMGRLFEILEENGIEVGDTNVSAFGISYYFRDSELPKNSDIEIGNKANK